MKLLFVYSPTIRSSSYTALTLEHLDVERTNVHINDYHKFDDSGYDFLIYNSFAGETHPLFKREFVLPADEKFYAFKGRKLLLDTQDEGNRDGFERLSDRNQARIKVTPGYQFMKEFNVVVPFTFRSRYLNWFRNEPKDLKVIFCGTKDFPFGHSIRLETDERIKRFEPYTQRHGIRTYGKLLRRSRICVCCPGSGTIGAAHTESLSARALMFSYETVNTVKLLPFADMVDGVNYVSFNMDNLEEKLEDLIKDDERVDRIALAGWEAFQVGYDPERSAKQIMKYFMEE